MQSPFTYMAGRQGETLCFFIRILEYLGDFEYLHIWLNNEFCVTDYVRIILVDWNDRLTYGKKESE